MKQNLFILLLIFFAQNTLAQVPVAATKNKSKVKPIAVVQQAKPYVADTVKNKDFSLKGQYQFMLARSRSSYGAKLINPARLDAFWKSVNDTLRKERLDHKDAYAKIASQQKTITDLQAQVTGSETALDESNSKLHEINFLGISFTKGTYQLMVWSIILVLALALVVVIARSAKNIIEAKHRTELYDDIATEYQAYKVKTNEQQRKLARELQDERNIIEEMKNKGK